jgi:cytoskeletal protein RodZ
MSIGTVLREARERKGLTIDDVAERTRMIHQMVDEMEHDDFHRIAAAIYGRGFIKLYSECVEIDPAPLLAEFNEVYTGFRKAPPEGSEESGKSGKPGKSGKSEKAEKKAAPVEAPKAADAVAETKPVEVAPEPKVKEETQAAPVATQKAEPEAKPEPEPVVEPETKPAPEPESKPEPLAVAEEEVVAPENQTPETREQEEPASAPAATLGELFDVERRRREEALLKNADQPKKHEEPSHLNLSVTEEAPSWDDAPLSEGDFLHRMLERLNIKVAAIAAAAVFACAIIIFAIVLASRPSQPGDEEGDTPPEPTPVADNSAAAPDEVIDPYTTPFAPPPDTYLK